MRSENDILDTRYCVAKRVVVDVPEYYCFGLAAQSEIIVPNLVGCLQVGLDISPYSKFYRTGDWLDIFGNYVFDKAKIISSTQRVLKKYRFCPFINETIIQKFVDLWPEKINVHLDNRWKFWPPQKDKFSEGLKELGLVSNTNMSKNYKPMFPIVTDTTYFIDLVRELYPDTISENLQATIYASIDAIQLNVFREYS